jgi:hypothetical protein
MKIFLSWSGDKSRLVAEALHEWLPNVIQGLDPWISVNDIEKGTAWRNEVAYHLEAAAVGIFCLTRENLERPWLLFEAGAISKRLDNAFVCTYLLNIEPTEIKDPLAQFQWTKATREDTRKLLHTINRAQKEGTLPQERIDKAFEKWWPELDQRLQSIPNIEQPQESKRSIEDMVSEILVTVRSLAQQIQPSPVTSLDSGDLYPQTHVHSGGEVEAILREVQKMNRGLVLTALEDAQGLEFHDRALTATFANDDVLAKRVRDSGDLFRDIGLRLFGHPMKVRVRIDPGPPLDIPDDSDPPHDNDIPF